MPAMIRSAMLLMVAALTCYTIGVWGERLARRLKPWHAAMFWAGFVADTSGTELMRRLAGGFTASLHTATGILALLLMFGHAVWATWVLRRHDEASIRAFHRISIVVWAIWLIPFLSGTVVGMRRAG